MKKTLFAAFALILALCFAVPCLAEEYKPGDEVRINVSADYRYSSEHNVYDSGVSNGKYVVVASDGANVTVTPESPMPDGARLVVRVVSEADEDAYRWFCDCTKEIGGGILPFDIFFIDAEGNKISAVGKMTVEIALPDGYGTPAVCFLSTDGKTTALESGKSGDSVVFETDRNGYYVVVRKTPQTGDSGNIPLLITLLLISGGAIVSAAVSVNRKRRFAKNEP